MYIQTDRQNTAGKLSAKRRFFIPYVYSGISAKRAGQKTGNRGQRKTTRLWEAELTNTIALICKWYNV